LAGAGILVGEDYEDVRDFLGVVSWKEGPVETPVHGKEALNKAQEKFFNAIIPDVDMPVMNGSGFYQAASRFDPHIGERFLFLTGNPTDKTVEFIARNRLRCLAIPVQIHDLESAASELLDTDPVAAMRSR
jgi:CheY-like chemotaxis protein